MSAAPSVNKTTVLILKNDKLIEIALLGEREKLVAGWITIAHKVRSFKPCDLQNDLWLINLRP